MHGATNYNYPVSISLSHPKTRQGDSCAIYIMHKDLVMN